MSQDPTNTPQDGAADITRDDPMIAAEYSLGLLEGEELMAARGKVATDKDFAWRKDWWDNWFVPLTDDVTAMEPSSDVWARIDAEVNAQINTPDGAEIVVLQSRLTRWRWTAAITSAAAALMLAVILTVPGNQTAPNDPVLAAADPLVAQVPIGDTGLRLDVTYMPESEQMLVGAIGLTADGVHDHELWLVPADGSELQSLGLVSPGEVIATQLSEEIVGNMGDGVSIVLTREPIGGKPEGDAAGPVVAEGAFSQV
ncbi:anti-sigma factor domain-containing protein [Erythrobacter sp. Alg231-14]|uniref:anti-sigma factor domain-containing protein n=1 Tax=Erythrobacter sp. Alg231-14 TaxID=1922225 RepID=UPI000D55D419